MPSILVCPLSAVPDCIRLHTPSHLVTLLSPEYMIETPDGFAAERHLRLPVDDVVDVQAGASPPTSEHVQRLLEFARRWDAKAPLLVHCWAGISRSMAGAFAVLCDRLGPGREDEVARTIRERAPHADPNRLIIRLADEALDRRGRMIGAVDAMGRGALAVEGVPVSFPVEAVTAR
jgi:predicted protein tyrosine phosphatase